MGYDEAAKEEDRPTPTLGELDKRLEQSWERLEKADLALEEAQSERRDAMLGVDEIQNAITEAVRIRMDDAPSETRWAKESRGPTTDIPAETVRPRGVR